MFGSSVLMVTLLASKPLTQKTQYIGKLAMDSALDLIDGKHLPKEQLQEAVLTTKENVDFLLRKHP
jgi:ribose transport system substrate-binding protein